jgi:DNA topoisomerase-2
VAQLAGDVSHLTSYLHGEASLCGAIVNMAQDFCGSNNLNLLAPNGAFGSRLGAGKDSASPRYIYTYANAATRSLFRPEDDALLVLKREEGDEVEPANYMPVLPMLLINGCNAIATGFSTTVPAYNPADVRANVLRMLGGEAPQPMTPWFRGFRGAVTPDGDGKWRVAGLVAQEAGAFTITELPPGVAFNKYAEWLQSDKSPVTMLENRCNEVAAHFKVRFKEEPPADPLTALKLVDSVVARNMYAFNTAGVVRKYDTALDMLTEWIPWRLARYEDRRQHLIAAAESQAALLRNKRRFVAAVVAKKLVPQDHDEAELNALLASKGFDAVGGGYDYLLSIQTRALTRDRVERLGREADEAQRAADAARATTAQALWRADLEGVL